jgi:hypothetical protein
MSDLYVTNKTDKTLILQYEFKELKFPSNETIVVSEDCARHIFGYGVSNKEPYMVSLGFIKTTNDIPDGLKILEKFEISQEQPKKNHLLSPMVERVPLPSKKGEGKVLSIN